jgi:hypothetical protein
MPCGQLRFDVSLGDGFSFIGAYPIDLLTTLLGMLRITFGDYRICLRLDLRDFFLADALAVALHDRAASAKANATASVVIVAIQRIYYSRCVIDRQLTATRSQQVEPCGQAPLRGAARNSCRTMSILRALRDQGRHHGSGVKSLWCEPKSCYFAPTGSRVTTAPSTKKACFTSEFSPLRWGARLHLSTDPKYVRRSAPVIPSHFRAEQAGCRD